MLCRAGRPVAVPPTVSHAGCCGLAIWYHLDRSLVQWTPESCRTAKKLNTAQIADTDDSSGVLNGYGRFNTIIFSSSCCINRYVVRV